MSTTMKRVLKDIPELVERLREERARQKDYLPTQGSMSFQVEEVPMVDKDGKAGWKPTVKLVGAAQGLALDIMEQAHSQVANKQDIPFRYYKRMLTGGRLELDLLCQNVNHWLSVQVKKKRLIRTIDGQVRAFLGSRYRIISHLDLVTQAVMVVTGQEKADTLQDQPWAKGARCFSWALSPMNLDVSFVNPAITVDLNNLAAGYTIHDTQHQKDNGGGGTGFLYAGHGTVESSNPRQGGWFMKPEGGSQVMPAVRIRNSETGHGGLTVTAGLYEAICDNTSHLGTQLAQVHLGGELDEKVLWSADTNDRMNQVIMAKVRDVVRSAFNPDELLKWAKRFKGLETVQVEDLKETVANLVTLGGLNEGVRDDILAAYHGMTQARGNLFDVQRGVTAAAHGLREGAPDVAASLEDLGGTIIEQGAKVLTLGKK